MFLGYCQVLLQNKHTTKLVRFYDGVDGLKTGYTSEAGYCLTATATRNNMRLIAVVFGEPESSTRNNEISKMLDYGFNIYSVDKVLSKDDDLGRIEVIKGAQKYVSIVPKNDVNVLYKKGENKKSISYDVEITEVKAPLKVGDIVGKLHLKENDKIIQSVPVTVSEDVEKASLLRLYFRYLADIFKGDINLSKK